MSASALAGSLFRSFLQSQIRVYSSPKWKLSSLPIFSYTRTLTINHKKASSVSVFTPQQRQKASEDRLNSLGPYLSKLPEKWIPYAELMRIEKPAGTWYLFFPSVWAILIAATETAAPLSSTLYTTGLFAIGAIIMRGAGCTINDMLDKDFDNKVIRTIERPVASGRVTRKQAATFLVGQLFLGLFVLLSLPLDCFILGAASLSLVFTYPLFKRFTYYPQVCLSLCFNWGSLLGFAAMGDWNWPLMIALHFATFNWTMIYDTIYAHQDKKWDIQAGVKSTALAWGDKTKTISYALSGLQISSLAFMGVYGSLGPGFWLGSAFFGYRVIQMIKKTNLDNMKSCWEAFNMNIKTGKVFTLAVLFDYVLKLFGWW